MTRLTKAHKNQDQATYKWQSGDFSAVLSNSTTVALTRVYELYWPQGYGLKHGSDTREKNVFWRKWLRAKTSERCPWAIRNLSMEFLFHLGESDCDELRRLAKETVRVSCKRVRSGESFVLCCCFCFTVKMVQSGDRIHASNTNREN